MNTYIDIVGGVVPKEQVSKDFALTNRDFFSELAQELKLSEILRRRDFGDTREFLALLIEAMCDWPSNDE